MLPAGRGTGLAGTLSARRIDTLPVCGAATAVCVHTAVQGADDRGYRCAVPADACGSYIPACHAAGPATTKAQGGTFGWVTASASVAAGRSDRSQAEPGEAVSIGFGDRQADCRAGAMIPSSVRWI